MQPSQRQMDRARAKKNHEDRQQGSGGAIHSGLPKSDKFIGSDTNSRRKVMENHYGRNTRIEITCCRQMVIALWWQDPIES